MKQISKGQKNFVVRPNNIIEPYLLGNIYNAGKTAIYFCAQPESTYMYIEAAKKKQQGFKTAKDQVTVLVTCNLHVDKEKLVQVGKIRSFCCFKMV